MNIPIEKATVTIPKAVLRRSGGATCPTAPITTIIPEKPIPIPTTTPRLA